jgi:hypothetical protein
MSLDKTVSVVSVAVALFFGSGVAPGSQASPSHQVSKGLIRGKVTSASGGVSDVKVLVEGAMTKREVVTNQSGDYETELPAGVYTVTATVPEYYPFRRAPFRVRPGTTTTIDLDLLFIGIDRVHGGGKDIHYEKLSLPYTSDEQLDLLIVYYDRKESDRVIEYEGLKVYYYALAVHAIKIQFDKRDFTFKATGNSIELSRQATRY